MVKENNDGNTLACQNAMPICNGFLANNHNCYAEQNGTVNETPQPTARTTEENGVEEETEQPEQLPKEAFELIIFGSIVQDLVSYTNCFPKPGESVRGHSFKTFCGGKGANQGVMAAKLGTRVSMIGYVGDDIFAATNMQSIASSGVDISLIQTLKGQSTGTACISVNADGENSIIVTLGANEVLGAKRAREVEPVIARAKMILCQQEIDQAGNLEAFRIARKYGVTTFFNPAPGHSGMDRTILPLCDIVCANENEAEFLTGLSLVTLEDAQKCAEKILDQGPRIVIITLGPRGALVAQCTTNGEVQIDKVDAPKVKAVDTVGAGDCFCGSLAHLLISAQQNGGKCTADDVVTAVRKAVQISAISVQKQGAQASYPEREELEEKGLLMAVPMMVEQTKC